MRLIDIDELAKHDHWKNIVRELVYAPTVDPVKHAKWVKTDYKPSIFTKCGLCGYRVEIQNKSPFCPGCGAKMDLKRFKVDGRKDDGLQRAD